MNLNREDTLVNSLCSIYKSYGYKKYNPECFEEYSLFLENRDFLVSKNVITFAGANGRLLALRPDVTLSVIKHLNVGRGECEKLYYNENVYRQGADGGDFKEISQVGVEVIGEIDLVCQAEICLLILKTLSEVSRNSLLCLSHMGFIEGLFDSFNVNGETRGVLYGYLKSKNTHDFEAFARGIGLNSEQVNIFTSICNMDGNSQTALRLINSFVSNDKMSAAVYQLQKVINVLYGLGYGDKIRLDFSVINDENYYDGIIFNGYVSGISRAVLSGGRYDKLVKKFAKNCGAIGFALYLGELERYFRSDETAVDELIIYGEDALAALKTAESIVKKGKSVRLSSNLTEKENYKKILNLKENGND